MRLWGKLQHPGYQATRLQGYETPSFSLDTPHGHQDGHCVALGVSCDVPQGGLTGPLMSRYRIATPNFTAEEAVGAMCALVLHAVEELLPQREPPLLRPGHH